MDKRTLLLCLSLPLSACSQAQSDAFNREELADFAQPWAMSFLPDGGLLVTEMEGDLLLYRDGETQPIEGVPEVYFDGQAGLGDVILHPDYENNQLVYISYAEAEGEVNGAAVARARLALNENGGELQDLEVIWRQEPKVNSDGHLSQRLVFGPDGYLWISSGDRQQKQPAQSMEGNLGKIIRLNEDGSVPEDNPFAERGGVAAQVWSLGHRNVLGMAFDAEGRLWAHEMGPQGGDELNLIEHGENYGWPEVSNGVEYSGAPIPDHDNRPEFRAPVIGWTPVISPAGFIIYDGDEFPAWQGDGFIGGLSSHGLVRVTFDGDSASEAERYELGERIREVEQGPDGALWVLEDGRRGGSGRLLKLSAAESQ